MVVWITGLSAAGKTTLCTAIYERLKPTLPHLVVLDGDVVRATLGNDLGYAESDRVIQIRRMQRLARALADQGLVVMVAALYANLELLAWNRANLPDYFEVLIDAPMDLLRSRDPKGLYAKAMKGETEHVVGVDIPWHRPASPDLVLDAASGASPDEMAHKVIAAVPFFSGAMRN